jgi:hypothetical protein
MDNNYNNGYNPNNQNYYNQQGNGYQQQGYQQPYPQQNYNQAPPADPTKGKSIASMVCGICSIVTCSLYGIIGLACGIVALVLANQVTQAKGGVREGFAKAGFICGVIGTILSALYFVLCILAWVGLATIGTFGSWY